MVSDTRWEDARRIEAWAGEVRVNLIRLAAILVFFGHHLCNVYLFQDDPALDSRFHNAVMALVFAWSTEVLLLHVALSRRWLPGWLKYAAIASDIVLVTLLLMVTGEPRTWLAVLYFLIIASGALRLSLPAVYAATLGSIAGYLIFLGYLRWGLEVPDAERVSRPNQVIVVLGLGTAGFLAGQVVRQARRLVHGYPVKVEADEGAL